MSCCWWCNERKLVSMVMKSMFNFDMIDIYSLSIRIINKLIKALLNLASYNSKIWYGCWCCYCSCGYCNSGFLLQWLHWLCWKFIQVECPTSKKLMMMMLLLLLLLLSSFCCGRGRRLVSWRSQWGSDCCPAVWEYKLHSLDCELESIVEVYINSNMFLVQPADPLKSL